VVRIGSYTFCAKGISHNIEMGVVQRIVFVRSGGNFSKRTRIEQFSATECGVKQVTVTLTAVHTATADSRLGCDVAGAVFCLQGLVSVGSM
jgi:hypothetical protein